MISYLIKRLIWTAVLMVIISFVTFMLFFVSPAEAPLGYRTGRETTNIAIQFQDTRQALPIAYVHFLWGIIAHGQLGHSFADGQAVTYKLEQALPVTLSLIVGGAILWILLALVIGILSALRPRSLFDRAGMVLALVGISIHPIALGIMLLYVFGLKLHWTPIAGYCALRNHDPQLGCGGAVDWFKHMLLPWITFSFLFVALYARMIRASMLETLNEDYVRTAWGKGAGRRRVLQSHVLRNALLPVVTMIGMDIGLAFAGAIFIEQVFNLPGIGQTMALSLSRRDMPVIMGIVLVVSVTVVMANTIVDVLYSVLDPRVTVTQNRTRARLRLRRARATAPTPPRSGGVSERRQPSPAVHRP